ncbi:MAG: hypothetical protein JO353_08320 [Phycisphaerae bacterium]|nr:hypothetical protein [Phycisphaerae bacterium]
MSYTGTGAIIGAGSSLAYSATSGGSYSALSELIKIGFPKSSVAKIKATNMQSLNLTSEYIAGFKDTAELSFEANYLKADMTTYQTQLRVQQWWKITLPDGSTFTFPGFLAEIDGDTEAEAKITVKGKLQVTGAITWVAGT